MISLLTFNVLQLPLRGSARRASLALQVIRDADADIVVLNEAFNRHSRALISQLTGYSVTAAAGGTGRRGYLSRMVGSGIHVLSRLPILESYAHTYEAYQPLTTDALSDKGVALLSFDVPGGLWLAATHLQADERGHRHGVRLVQLAELRALVSAKAPADQPVLIAGDLNTEPADRRSANAAIDGRIEPSGRLHAATYDGRNPLTGRRYAAYAEVLDYVGYLDETGRRPHPKISTETLVFPPGREASDHYPVLARITV
ncbi:endonuclease/exonuclease/phosphatase family protein [Fodinicola acaciae]|uniref:endonuclease/exonuclease/phosphatase family protein n=1 Tax=Fodinicola acaciae TaxID=2681555 RepID=UPI0013CF4252|nr:endonuclease/exonuclease/phosphatase family protein [Fodinicola acaciae]